MTELVNLEECVGYVVKVVRRDDRTLYGKIKSRPHDKYHPFLFDLGYGGGVCYRKCGRATEKADGLDIIWIKKIAKETEIDPSLITKDGDNIYFRGEKYKKVEEPKTFYNKLWGLVSDKVGNNPNADELTDRIMDLIRDTIPDPSNRMFMNEYLNNGYKATVKLLQEKFK
jgi:hypothetical protein